MRESSLPHNASYLTYGQFGQYFVSSASMYFAFALLYGVPSELACTYELQHSTDMKIPVHPQIWESSQHPGHTLQDAPSMPTSFEKSYTKQNSCDKRSFSEKPHGPLTQPWEPLCPLLGLGEEV